MFVHLLLNAAHKGSCRAVSSVKASWLALLWSLRGPQSGFHLLQGRGWGIPEEQQSSYCLLQLPGSPEGKGVVGVNCRAAVPQGVSWALFLCWTLAAHNNPSIALIKSAHKKLLAEISIKNILVRRKKVFDFFFKLFLLGSCPSVWHAVSSAPELLWGFSWNFLSCLCVCYLTIILIHWEVHEILVRICHTENKLFFSQLG